MDLAPLTPAKGARLDIVSPTPLGTVDLHGDARLGTFDRFAAAAGSQFANAGWELTFQPNSWLGNVSENQLTKLTVYARPIDHAR